MTTTRTLVTDIPTDYYIEVRVGKMHAFITLDSAEELQPFVADPDGWAQTGTRLRRALDRDHAFEQETP
jgi:hypothetical protein